MLGLVTRTPVTLLLTFYAGTAYGQPDAGPVTSFVTVNFGVQQPSVNAYDSTATSAPNAAGSYEFRAKYNRGARPVFDIGSGVLFFGRFSVGLSVSRHSDRQAATAVLTFLRPPYAPAPSAPLRNDGLERTETGVHIQFGCRIPTNARIELLAFGGPSLVSLAQELFATVEGGAQYDPRTDTYSVVLSGSRPFTAYGSAWGFNVGADVATRIAAHLSAGALVRYTRATVTVDDPVFVYIEDRHAEKPLEVGGLQLMFGVRARFW